MISKADAPIGTGKAGKMLGVEPKTVAKMCESGKLAGAFRLGEDGQWRIPRSAVQAFIDANRPRRRQSA